MKIINELSNSQIENNKKDTLATRLSIFLAVVLLGTIIFIIGTVRADKHHEIVSTLGDYQVSISDLDKNRMEKLFNNNDIKKLSFDKYISTDLNAVIIEKGTYFKNLKGFEIIQGHNINSANELIAPTRFFESNKEYKIGSKLKVKGVEYTLVGEYRDNENSFKESALIGILPNENKENILNNLDGIEVFIWYKSPRDTYSITKQIFDEFKLDYSKSLDTGRLYFNKAILEHKMINPSGLIPPKSVILDWFESYGACIALVLLFTVMIYGAFNVWNNRDIKEFALLKSVGMTEKQVKKMIRLKAIKIGMIPIFLGIAVSYLTANLLIYLMWLNNSITYKNMSTMFGEQTIYSKFHLVPLSLAYILVILCMSFLTVYLSAILPAIRSAKLNIIEGLLGIEKRKVRNGKSDISCRVENTLAKDYFRTYKRTYRTIILAILLSALVMTVVLVSQAYRTVNLLYGQFNSPYNLTAQIQTSSKLNKTLINDIQKVNGIDKFHIYTNKGFKFYLKDNKGFESEDLKKSLKSGKKNAEDLYANIVGLYGKDFDTVVSTNKLNKESSYVLLNKTSKSNKTPYLFRKYINLTNGYKKDLILRYNADGKQIPIHIDSYIDEFPFELDVQDKSGIYIFTRMNNVEQFVKIYGQDEGAPVNDYTIKIKTHEKNLAKVSSQYEKIISSYIPKSDYSISNDILKRAANKEQLRNEHLLNIGIQIILVILALSNAYNSFHGNLRARKRDFQLLTTAGMTEKQIKKMIYQESKILFKKVSISYIIVFVLAVCIRSYRSDYEFTFIFKEILLHLNYVPILLIFGVVFSGIFLSIRSSIKMIFQGDLSNVIKDI